MRTEGIIIRALSGFYYVHNGKETIVCRAKGRFRKDRLTPLVGDRVVVEVSAEGSGTVAEILPRHSSFGRPAVANIDLLVVVISEALPITDPYLADRVTVRCEKNGVGSVIVINKCDLEPGERLAQIYETTGYPVLRVSAKTGFGIDELRKELFGKICCFTGNSGVGKSSILNALHPGFSIPTDEISVKLGRGKHTTRHVEFFDLGEGTYIADTPGFASFGDESEQPILPEELASLFPEFSDYENRCRFDDCTHRKEPGCAVREAVDNGVISPSRYNSYLRMYEEASLIKPWEIKNRNT